MCVRPRFCSCGRCAALRVPGGRRRAARRFVGDGSTATPRHGGEAPSAGGLDRYSGVAMSMGGLGAAADGAAAPSAGERSGCSSSPSSPPPPHHSLPPTMRARAPGVLLPGGLSSAISASPMRAAACCGFLELMARTTAEARALRQTQADGAVMQTQI